MNVLITGISGYIGSLLAPRLLREGHQVRGLSRRPAMLADLPEVPVFEGDAVTGIGLEQALEGIEVAYFLIHSMESAATGGENGFADRDRRAAALFGAAAGRD